MYHVDMYYNDDLAAVHACFQLSKYKWFVQHVLLWQAACMLSVRLVRATSH